MDFLAPINTAVTLLRALFLSSQELQDRKDSENKMIQGDLRELLVELSKTHQKLVETVDPLRGMDDNPQTFAKDYAAVYRNFRGIYDAKDFVNERTHCTKVEAIVSRLENRRPRLGSDAQWAQWHSLIKTLRSLDTADGDIIERTYLPFMKDFNNEMKHINQLVINNPIEAINVKNAFLNKIEPTFDENKAKLKEMTDLYNRLIANL
jgi:hypothetical protein